MLDKCQLGALVKGIHHIIVTIYSLARQSDEQCTGDYLARVNDGCGNRLERVRGPDSRQGIKDIRKGQHPGINSFIPRKISLLRGKISAAPMHGVRYQAEFSLR